jgi:hypothetical protein
LRERIGGLRRMINGLPWKVSEEDVQKIINTNNMQVARTTPHNAEYIVKACNMFPELVEALGIAIKAMREEGMTENADYLVIEKIYYKAKEESK